MKIKTTLNEVDDIDFFLNKIFLNTFNFWIEKM